jgi:DNA ligase D-like protein (predicted polymerase)
VQVVVVEYRIGMGSKEITPMHWSSCQGTQIIKNGTIHNGFGWHSTVTRARLWVWQSEREGKRRPASCGSPYLQDRPFIMRLWPDGITGKNFYRWRSPAHAPEWLHRFVYQLQTAQRTAEMPVVDDAGELIWVVNQGVIEMHPWVATRNDPEHPTWMFFDLDPAASVSFERVLEVAGWIGEMLEALGLLGLPKTSGGDGVHIFVPLAPLYSFEEVRSWLGAFVEQLSRRYEGAVTSDKRLAAREGKVLIDYSQNAMGKSIVAPYSVRAKPGAPVHCAGRRCVSASSGRPISRCGRWETA